MATCRHCKATVLWAVTPLGTRVPLNFRPDPAGDLVPVRDEFGRLHRDVDGRPMVRRISTAAALAAAGRRWSSHYTTCTRNPARTRGAAR